MVKLSSIGDVVHALPILKSLRDTYPEAYIAWMIKRTCKDIIEGNPYLDEVIIFERARWGKLRNIFLTVKEIFLFMKSIRSKKFDVVVDFQGLFYTGLVTFFTGCKKRYGFKNAREFSFIFYNRKVAVPTMEMHAVNRYFLLAEALGATHRKPEFTIAVSSADSEKVDSLLAQYTQGDSTKPVIAINPSARWITKQWQMEKFAELSDALARQMNAVIVLIGSSADKELVERLIERMKTNPLNATGRTNLKQLVALLEKTDLVISNDTGPMHIAVAVGTPVLGLFGPTNPVRTGPFGLEHVVIRKDIFCSPCLKKKCCDLICMDLLTTEDVLHAVHENIVKGTFSKISPKKVDRLRAQMNIIDEIGDHTLDVLILSDGKAGHVNQTVGMVKNIDNVNYHVARIKYRTTFHRGLAWVAGVCGLGETGFLKSMLKPNSYRQIMESVPKVVLSAGISVAPINLMLGRIFKAKKVVSMKPGPLKLKRFDLAIIPMHDDPPKMDNVVETLGAPNIIGKELLEAEKDKIVHNIHFKKDIKIGVFIGGETPDYFISKKTMLVLIQKIKDLCNEFDAEVLIATSRRTARGLEKLLSQAFDNDPRCKMLLLASQAETNPIPGILSVSDIIVVTEESISMVSEAASSGKYVFVLKIDRKENRKLKQERTIEELVIHGYVLKSDVFTLYNTIVNFWPTRKPPKILNDTVVASEALAKLLEQCGFNRDIAYLKKVS